MTIERGVTMALAGLEPHPRNYNAHPKRQIEELRRSLRAFGQVRDIVVWRSFIVAGHGMVEAARLEGWESISATQLPEDWPEERVLAYLAVDNETARLSEPDNAQLAALLQAVSDEELQALAAGGERRLRELLGTEVADPGPQVDKAEELRQKWGTELGQLWQLGEHLLLCGDSTRREDVERVMGGERAGACITDPPYNVGFGYEGEYKGKDDKSPKDYGEFLNTVLVNAETFTTPAAPFFIWQGQLNVAYFSTWFAGRDWRLFAACKNFIQCRPTWLQFAWDPVVCWTNGKSKAKKNVGVRDWHIAETSITKPTQDRIISGLHPCPRPLDTVCFILDGHTEAGGIVLDPFAGSGTTIIACQNLGRKCRAIEIAPGYVAVTLERLSQMGLEPRLVDDGN